MNSYACSERHRSIGGGPFTPWLPAGEFKDVRSLEEHLSTRFGHQVHLSVDQWHKGDVFCYTHGAAHYHYKLVSITEAAREIAPKPAFKVECRMRGPDHPGQWHHVGTNGAEISDMASLERALGLDSGAITSIVYNGDNIMSYTNVAGATFDYRFIDATLPATQPEPGPQPLEPKLDKLFKRATLVRRRNRQRGIIEDWRPLQHAPNVEDFASLVSYLTCLLNGPKGTPVHLYHNNVTDDPEPFYELLHNDVYVDFKFITGIRQTAD